MINPLIDELKKHSLNFELIASDVSNASIGWHIVHSLKVIEVVINQLEKSNPNEYQSSFNFKKILFFTINKFPRGKARAPKSVQPKNKN